MGRFWNLLFALKKKCFWDWTNNKKWTMCFYAVLYFLCSSEERRDSTSTIALEDPLPVCGSQSESEMDVYLVRHVLFLHFAWEMLSLLFSEWPCDRKYAQLQFSAQKHNVNIFIWQINRLSMLMNSVRQLERWDFKSKFSQILHKKLQLFSACQSIEDYSVSCEEKAAVSMYVS